MQLEGCGFDYLPHDVLLGTSVFGCEHISKRLGECGLTVKVTFPY